MQKKPSGYEGKQHYLRPACGNGWTKGNYYDYVELLPGKCSEDLKWATIKSWGKGGGGSL